MFDPWSILVTMVLNTFMNNRNFDSGGESRQPAVVPPPPPDPVIPQAAPVVPVIDTSVPKAPVVTTGDLGTPDTSGVDKFRAKRTDKYSRGVLGATLGLFGDSQVPSGDAGVTGGSLGLPKGT